MRTTRWFAVGCLVAGVLPAAAGVLEFTVGQTVPDGLGSGLADVRTVSGVLDPVMDLRVRLELRGTGIGGMINGDIYATLAYEAVPGQVDAFTVLLNRVGRDAGMEDGYFDDGFDVTFAVSGPDIHRYAETVVPVAGSPLTGIWGSDGREADPGVVMAGDPRTALLDGFQGITPNGKWTLFVADLVPGGEAELVGWGLEWTPVPEPEGWVGVAGLGLACWAGWRRRSRG